MVLVGGKPIIWHIMQIYIQQGFNDFVIATGYKHDVIEEWIGSLSVEVKAKALFTGLETQTGGRIKRCIELEPEQEFFVTYGDGVGNIDLKKLLASHRDAGRLATVTAVRPPSRFGVLEIHSNRVVHFGEKNQANSGWINGGFFVINREVASIIQNDSVLFETGPLPRLAEENELTAHLHNGFWQPMDTLRERNLLNELSKNEPPPWLEF